MSQVRILPFCFAILGMWTLVSSAKAEPQSVKSNEKEQEHSTQPKTFSEQLNDLSRQVSELQSKVTQQGVDAASMKANGDEYRLKMSVGTQVVPQVQSPISPTAVSSGPGQKPDPEMAGGMMGGMMSMMNSMMGGGMGGMAADAPMGQAAGMGPSAALSVLPGFPGASHLYHIGSTNFFLDHPQHILLSLEQQSVLSDLRMKALMRRSDANRSIQAVEEQLWFLTASDQPNFSSIEAKVREAEKLQGDFRLSLI